MSKCKKKQLVNWYNNIYGVLSCNPTKIDGCGAVSNYITQWNVVHVQRWDCRPNFCWVATILYNQLEDDQKSCNLFLHLLNVLSIHPVYINVSMLDNTFEIYPISFLILFVVAREFARSIRGLKLKTWPTMPKNVANKHQRPTSERLNVVCQRNNAFKFNRNAGYT